MEVIKKENIDAWKWLQKEGYETWARSHFSEELKAEQVCNNFSESFNSWILELRDLPIVNLLDQYHLLLMSLRYKRKQACKGWDQNGLVPRVNKHIAKMIEICPSYIFEGFVNGFSAKTSRQQRRQVADVSNKLQTNETEITKKESNLAKIKVVDFYKDLFEELSKYGEIESLNIYDNLADHMVGNVYVQFREEEHVVAAAVQYLTRRFYAGVVHLISTSLWL
ncbi:hypothetical protein IFM89_002232 [Coptis chinensis]|uniref:RRM domain-containing protein n=1 Tax=Coptis chinensis TaxID=261450 RepID=A0A835IL95_9MAGN|nr:hypothetical protein IFM89_002232 [Coptis chinensis]